MRRMLSIIPNLSISTRFNSVGSRRGFPAFELIVYCEESSETLM